MSPGGIGTVAGLELRQRLRTGRWRVLLTVWFVVLAVVTLGLRQFATGDEDHGGFGLQTPVGAVMFGGLSLFLLAVALLVVPALSAQSVNGDRDRGVLATLQVTDLTPGELALGKFAAAWLVALVFLAVSLPLSVWAAFEGGVGVLRLIVVTLVQGLLLGVVAAISLGLSALLARTTTSAVLSYLAVLGLTVGTLIAFGLAGTLVQSRQTVSYGSYSDVETVTHTERIWWLLAPNPIVIMVDASPAPPRRSGEFGFSSYSPVGTQEFAGVLPPTPDPSASSYVYGSGGLITNRLGVTTVPGQPDDRLVEAEVDANDPLRSVRREVRDVRRSQDDETSDTNVDPGPVWPWGLGFDVALGAGFLVLATRRLRTPARTLPRGTRVA